MSKEGLLKGLFGLAVFLGIALAIILSAEPLE